MVNVATKNTFCAICCHHILQHHIQAKLAGADVGGKAEPEALQHLSLHRFDIQRTAICTVKLNSGCSDGEDQDD